MAAARGAAHGSPSTRELIRAIAFTAYPSDDVARTRAWYENILGLSFAGPYLEDDVERYNEAHLGDGCFSLMWSKWVGREPGSGAGVAFEVADIEAAIRSLRDKGVTIDGVEDGPLCKTAAIRDPEGNKVTLHQQKARP
jgi:catechol 2,3-dioxygenase-like lactoylglutathione lyase family enzyme